jgi:hypothetical protein
MLAALLIGLVAGNVSVAFAAEVGTYAFDGDSAGAVFETRDGCLTRSAIVRPLDGVSRGNKIGTAAESSVLIHLIRSDPCSDTFETRIGRVELAATDFQVQGDLGRATLELSSNFRDWLTGQVVPLEIHLTWRAAGDRVTTRHNSRTRYPDGSVWITRSMGTMRDAVASGRIWDGAYDYAAAGESASGDLATNRLGFVAIDWAADKRP